MGPGPSRRELSDRHGVSVGGAIGPAYFTVANTATRLANLAADPWAGFRQAAVPLPTTRRRKAA